MRVAGIVLAGGASRRFGGDKLAVELDGRTLLERAVEAVAVVSDVVVVALATAAPDPPVATPAGVALYLVHDAAADVGPLAGLAAGLVGAAEAGAERAIVVAGDMPWLRPTVLEALLDAIADPAVDACAPIVGGARRPLPAAVEVEPALAAVRDSLAAGRRSLLAPLDRLRTVDFAEAAWRTLDPEASSFRDVDRQTDLGPAGQAETGDPVR